MYEADTWQIHFTNVNRLTGCASGVGVMACLWFPILMPVTQVCSSTTAESLGSWCDEGIYICATEREGINNPKTKEFSFHTKMNIENSYFILYVYQPIFETRRPVDVFQLVFNNAVFMCNLLFSSYLSTSKSCLWEKDRQPSSTIQENHERGP